MKRRTFLAGLAGTPVLGAPGNLVRSTRARERDVRAIASERRAPVAASPTPIPAIDTRHAALLVMDYQPAWIQTLADGDALLSRAAEAVAIARDHGAHVAYARVAFTPADYAAVPAYNVIFNHLAAQTGLLDDGAPQTEIDDRVAPETGDKVVRKTRVDAFARTDLDGWLRGLGIDTLILAGISTSGVVLSTVCSAADRDYRLLILADACADQDPELHDTLTNKVFPQRAEVITVAELPDLLRPAS